MMQTRTLTPDAPYAPLCWGTLEESVHVGGKTRRFLTYIPDGVRPSAAGVFILGRDHRSARDLLENSGWRAIADQEKIILFFLEPEDGTWKIREEYGDESGDIAFVGAALMKATERLHYCVHEAKFYLYGEEEGGTIAHMAAMNPPIDLNTTAVIWAGLTTINAHEVPDTYRRACQDAPCVNLMGFWDTENALGLKKGDVPMPVWMIEDDAHKAPETLLYWQNANEVDPLPQIRADGTETYLRTKDTEYPHNQDKNAYCVWRTSGAEITEMPAAIRAAYIWSNFLCRHRRWMGDPGGELRMTTDPVRDLGMEYHTEEIGGWLREWYVYAPESIQKRESPSPLVFAMHGYSCTNEIYAGHSNWHRVAEDRGFIVVYPTALPGTLGFKTAATDPENIPLPAWNFLHNMPNGPDEFEFFKTILERVCATHSVDRTRVYATGHSHGSMMTQALGLAMPELFAAVAPCSGVILEAMHEDFMKLPELRTNPEPIPIWMFVGKKEEWLINAEPALENATGKTLAIWHQRNRLPGCAEKRFGNGWTTYKERWHDLVYRDDVERPMLRFTTVDNFPHATNPEMSFRIWDEFFAHWSRKGGVLHYQ